MRGGYRRNESAWSQLTYSIASIRASRSATSWLFWKKVTPGASLNVRGPGTAAPIYGIWDAANGQANVSSLIAFR